MRKIDTMPLNNPKQFLEDLNPNQFYITPKLSNPIVDPRPDIDFLFFNSLDYDRLLLVMASDGLWQYLNEENDDEILDLVQRHYPSAIAEIVWFLSIINFKLC